MGGFVGKVTDTLGLTNYGDQKDAVTQAANQQLAATDKQIGFLKDQSQIARDQMQPYQDFGQGFLPQAAKLLTPQGGMDYLQNNPMFSAAIDNTNQTLLKSGAASGKVGSGGMVDALFKNYLSTGESFINNQFNRLFQPITMGQNSAAGIGANAMNLGNNVAGVLGNQGDIMAGNTMARNNINNQAVSQFGQMVFGSLLGSGMLGGGGIAGGGMSGAGLGALRFSDARLKEAAERIGETDEGIPIYKWRYKGDPQMHVGPMAQDVERVKPEAVLTHSSGYKLLNLEAL
jgi:hypothetical protein